MTQHAVVNRQDWIRARKELLEKEREMNHALDRLREERRALPWVRLEKDYVFHGPSGDVALADLFEGRSQLAIYHFMLAPDAKGLCPGCSLVMDHLDAARQHFEHADLSFAAVARAPVAEIEAVKARMGWKFRWFSSADSDFNYDFEVSFTPADKAAGRALYNYGVTKIEKSSDMFGVSIFVKEGDAIFHTYSTYHRGVDLLIGAMAWLDLTPKGRNESGTMSWVRVHDQYEVRARQS